MLASTEHGAVRRMAWRCTWHTVRSFGRRNEIDADVYDLGLGLTVNVSAGVHRSQVQGGLRAQRVPWLFTSLCLCLSQRQPSSYRSTCVSGGSDSSDGTTGGTAARYIREAAAVAVVVPWSSWTAFRARRIHTPCVQISQPTEEEPSPSRVEK